MNTGHPDPLSFDLDAGESQGNSTSAGPLDLEAGFVRRLSEDQRLLAVALHGQLGHWMRSIFLLSPALSGLALKIELWRDDKADEPMGYALSAEREEERVVPPTEAAMAAWSPRLGAMVLDALVAAAAAAMRPKYVSLFDMLPNHGDSMSETLRFSRDDLDWTAPIDDAALAALAPAPGPQANDWAKAGLTVRTWNAKMSNVSETRRPAP